MGRSLVFALNGQRVELEAVDPRTTVLQYIRSQTSLQGTKLSCGEGGCGACTVLLSKYDPTSGRVDELTINSCLALLCSIDGCAITTTEGLKPSKNEFHAVHQRLAGFHGSQCGFCTPGMSMAIYGGLRKAAAAANLKSGVDTTTASANGHEHGHGQSDGSTGCGAPQQGLELSVAEARKCINGNICRCTGYRPILDTCSSFSGDVDVEDLGVNSFWESKHQARANLLPSYDPAKDPKFPEFLVEELKAREEAVAAAAATQLSFKHVEGKQTIAERVWITPTSLGEIFSLLKEHSARDVEVKLVVGNTSAGVYKDMKPQVYIDISKLPELQKVQSTDDGLEVGAGVALSKLIGLLDAEPESNKTVVYTELSKHINQIASVQVRNRASLGGNLILAQQRGFDSDLATILLGAGTTVTVARSEGVSSTISLEEFLAQPDAGAVLLCIRIPSWKKLYQAAGEGDKQELLFKTYRVSVRPNGNAVSYINAAFLAVVNRSGPGSVVVDHLRLAFGAFGGPHALRAVKTERALVGKPISPAALLEAIKVLKGEIKPPPSLHKAAYRGSVAVGFLFEFFRSFLDDKTVPASIISTDKPALENGHKATAGADGSHAHGDDSPSANNGTNHKAVQNGGVHHPDTSAANGEAIHGSDGKASSNGSAAAGSNWGNVANGSTLESSAPEVAAEGSEEKESLVAEFGKKANVAPVSSSPAISAVEEDKAENESYTVEFGSKDKPVKGTGKSKHFQSSQKFATSKQFWPVGQSSKKVGVELQAAGESVYVDDVPQVKGTLYAQFVFNNTQPGKIVRIDTTEALRSPGVVDFINAKDIPGENCGYFIMMFSAPLFAENRVDTVNDVVGLVVAESYEHARDGAAKVVVHVEEEEGSLYTIEEAVANESFGDHGPFFQAAKHATYGQAPAAKSDHRIENAELYSTSQYHFYMEPQVAYAVPDEDGCMTVYSANQAPNGMQAGVAKCLGVPMNNVRVITRRLGGAFGGKMRRASMVAVSCALAAQKLGRPVRMFLDRQTDMRFCAGRHESKGVYNLDFDNDGKVNSLQVKVFMDAGRADDFTPLICHGVMSSLRQYNWGHLDSGTIICKTNKTARAVMRGPGEIQGHYIAESIMEHVAGYLGLDPSVVREKNMHTLESLNTFFPGTGANTEDSYTLPHLWHKLKDTSNFEERKRAIQKFNAESKWVKKGIDMVVGLYVTSTIVKQSRVSIFEDGSIVVEVGGVDMGQGLWTKVRQAVAYGLNKLWEPAAHPLDKVDTSRIRIVQNDTLSLPNSEPTGASTGSEACCQAALYACAELVESFKPIVQKLREVNGGSGGPVPFEAIIGTAKFGGAKLTATGIFATPPAEAGYVNFGVGVSEVSIDLLTGATAVLQTDMHYDAGKSLNPALDIGQVEGSFMMGLGFYLTEEWQEDKGRVISNSTWDYKPPTADNIPQKLHIELSNTKANKDRILSSKASGEPPILLAKSVHSAIRQAIIAAREDHGHPSAKAEDGNKSYFVMQNVASIDKVKGHCGLDIVEKYLEALH